MEFAYTPETSVSAIISSGSDVTVFLEEQAEDVGIDLTNAPEELALTDTGLAIPCRLAPLRIRIADATGETCEWQATVGFTNFPLLRPLFGHRGCLEFFTATLLGEVRQVVLNPNKTFSGLHILPP